MFTIGRIGPDVIELGPDERFELVYPNNVKIPVLDDLNVGDHDAIENSSDTEFSQLTATCTSQRNAIGIRVFSNVLQPGVGLGSIEPQDVLLEMSGRVFLASSMHDVDQVRVLVHFGVFFDSSSFSSHTLFNPMPLGNPNQALNYF